MGLIADNQDLSARTHAAPNKARLDSVTPAWVSSSSERKTLDMLLVDFAAANVALSIIRRTARPETAWCSSGSSDSCRTLMQPRAPTFHITGQQSLDAWHMLRPESTRQPARENQLRHSCLDAPGRRALDRASEGTPGAIAQLSILPDGQIAAAALHDLVPPKIDARQSAEPLQSGTSRAQILCHSCGVMRG